MLRTRLTSRELVNTTRKRVSKKSNEASLNHSSIWRKKQGQGKTGRKKGVE